MERIIYGGHLRGEKAAEIETHTSTKRKMHNSLHEPDIMRRHFCGKLPRPTVED